MRPEIWKRGLSIILANSPSTRGHYVHWPCRMPDRMLEHALMPNVREEMRLALVITHAEGLMVQSLCLIMID